GSRYGYTKAILRAHGFSMEMMVELVKAGLATTKRERIVADGRQTAVVRVRITDAGRQALAKMSKISTSANVRPCFVCENLFQSCSPAGGRTACGSRAAYRGRGCHNHASSGCHSPEIKKLPATSGPASISSGKRRVVVAPA